MIFKVYLISKVINQEACIKIDLLWYNAIEKAFVSALCKFYEILAGDRRIIELLVDLLDVTIGVRCRHVH